MLDGTMTACVTVRDALGARPVGLGLKLTLATVVALLPKASVAARIAFCQGPDAAAAPRLVIVKTTEMDWPTCARAGALRTLVTRSGAACCEKVARLETVSFPT